MGAQTVSTYSKGPPRLVGHVYSAMRITNAADRVRFADGAIASTAVRSVELSHVLIDTGASHLCLPADIIAELGLDVADVVTIQTAAGTGTARLCEGARLELEGRVDTFSCLELPIGSAPLVGVIPLEALGLEPDLVNQRLRVLPRHGKDTHILAY